MEGNMIEYTNDQKAIIEIAALLARGVCRYWKATGFQQNNNLNQLDITRNTRPYVHRKSRRQRRDSND
jgi:hypothetical protein